MRLPIFSALATLAASLTLIPLFERGDWLWSLVGALILQTAAMTLASRLPIPQVIASPIAGLVTLWLYLTVRFAPGEAYLGFLPTFESIGELGRITGAGWQAIQSYAPPAPSNVGLLLITTGGVGTVAVIVDFVAVRLRRAALAGLPLLALFTVPAAIQEEAITWVWFVLGAIGFTALLTADGKERVSRWGRPILARRSTAAEAGESTAFSIAGRRIGFAAVALALVVPVVLPELEPATTLGFGSGGNGSGGNTVTTPDPLARVQGELRLPAERTILTYQTSAKIPPYLRMYSLDVFKGDKWEMAQITSGPRDRVNGRRLPPPSDQVNSPIAQSSIKIEEEVTDTRFLPLPYPAAQVSADGDWRLDRVTGMVWSRADDAAGLQYDVSSWELNPGRHRLEQAAEAPEAIKERYLQLPKRLPEEIEKMARKVTKGARTPYDKAVALQEWFTGDGDFTYNLQTKPTRSGSALRNFLLTDRTGYCEQFAAGYAVMARMLGIPARVAIGYTSGEATGAFRRVTTSDAHAWPEVYFHGVGWIRFEPTPSGPSGQDTATVPGYSIPAPEAQPGDRGNNNDPSADPTSDPSAGSDDPRQEERRGREGRDPDGLLAPEPGVTTPIDPGMSTGEKLGLVALAGLLLAAIPAAARFSVRIRRRISSREVSGAATGGAGPDPVRRPGTLPAHAAWAELCDVLYDLGIPAEPSMSPRALARHLIERHELSRDQAAALTRITSAEERTRYAPSGTAVPRNLGGELRTVRRALAETVPRGRRVRAVLIPPSMLRRFRLAAGRVFDALEWNPAFLRRWQRG